MGSFLQQLVQDIETYRLDRYSDVWPVIAKIRSGRMSEDEARRCLIGLQPLIEKQRRFPNVLPPPPEAEDLFADGPVEVELGTTENGLRWGISPLRQVVHMLVTGATGFAKTAFVRRLVQGVCELSQRTGCRIVLVLWDPKCDCVDLPQLCGGQWLMLNAPDTLRFSLQRPRHVDPDCWINVICSTLAHRTNMIASRIGVTRIVRWLYRAFRRRGGTIELWPSLRNVLEVIQISPWHMWFERSEYAATATTTLTDAVENSKGMLDCHRGFDVNDAIEKGINVSIGLSELSLPWLKLWLPETVGNQIYYERLSEHHKVDNTEVVFGVDESDEFLSAGHDASSPLGLGSFGKFFKQFRELGVRCVVVASVIKNLSAFVTANVGDYVMHRQADPESIVAARRTLMTPPRGDEMLAKLGRGQCIVRQAMSGFADPFLSTSDYVAPYRGGRPQYDSHPFIPSQSLNEMPEILADLQALIARHKADRGRKAKQDKPWLPDAAYKLLNCAAENPWIPVGRLWELMADGFSWDAKKAAVKTLKDLGFACFESPRIGRTRKYLIQLQPEGWEHLGKRAPEIRGRGGVTHRHLAYWVAGWLMKHGRKAIIEWPVPPRCSHHVDVASPVADNRFEAFEIVVGCDENIADAVRATLIDSDVVATVSIVVLEKKRIAEVRGMIEADSDLRALGDRIRYELAESFVPEV